MKQPLEIGKGFRLTVTWYDHVPEPERNQAYEGEVVGWRNTQLIVRVKDYAVLRFWRRNGMEVGNPDSARRGFRLELSELTPSATEPAAPAAGVTVKLDA